MHSAKEESMNDKERIKVPAGFAIVMAGNAGGFGASLIAKEHKDELLTRFPSSLIRSAAAFGESGEEEIIAGWLKENTEIEIPVSVPVGEGGVFKALWALGEEGHTGFAIDIKQIPIKQETIEICNFFDINPYRLMSKGPAVFFTKEGDRCVHELKNKGVAAQIIGFTHKENKRVVLSTDEERFIEPRLSDSLEEISGRKEAE